MAILKSFTVFDEYSTRELQDLLESILSPSTTKTITSIIQSRESN